MSPWGINVKWYIKYFKYWTEDVNQLSWIERRTGIARQRVQTPLRFWIFQASMRNCINYVHNCENQRLLDLLPCTFWKRTLIIGYCKWFLSLCGPMSQSSSPMMSSLVKRCSLWSAEQMCYFLRTGRSCQPLLTNGKCVLTIPVGFTLKLKDSCNARRSRCVDSWYWTIGCNIRKETLRKRTKHRHDRCWS